jgi:hypothetical protein
MYSPRGIAAAIGAVALLGSGQALGAWTEVYKDATGATVYADPATIRREGIVVRMWGVIDYPTAQVNARNHRYFSQKRLAEYDCENQRVRIHMIGDYFGRLGRGGLAFKNAKPEKWESIATAGDVAEGLWKYACGKQ